MADVTVYHNPKCSTSRTALEYAAEAGVEIDVVEYLKTKPDAAELQAIIDKLDDPVTDLVRRDPYFKELGLSEDDVQTVEQIVPLLVEHTRLLQRPILIRGDVAIIGRPKERMREFLGLA